MLRPAETMKDWTLQDHIEEDTNLKIAIDQEAYLLHTLEKHHDLLSIRIEQGDEGYTQQREVWSLPFREMKDIISNSKQMVTSQKMIVDMLKAQHKMILDLRMKKYGI